MPEFDTPKPITVSLDVAIGEIRITASERTDTVVEVRPSNAENNNDTKAAGQTKVDYANGRLKVKSPKPPALFGKSGSVDVIIDLPDGSSVDGEATLADLHAEGRFGEFTFRTVSGEIRLDRTGPLRLETTSGDITVHSAKGEARVEAGSGKIRIHEVKGNARIKSVNGDTRVDEITGELRVNAGNGAITVDRAHADVTAKSANGHVHVGEVARGQVVLETTAGNLEIGVRDGSAAWLDLQSVAGQVRNSMEATSGPDGDADTVEVRARTVTGDILIRRS
jgi:hypothetical protein